MARTNWALRAVMISAGVLAVTAKLQADIWYVDVNATGNDDCSRWADACRDLQAALELATGPDNEIWVAKGTYKPDRGTGDRKA